MEKLKVLLVCGSGASSGFMAANIRKVAKKRGIDITVIARSESEIENYVSEINCLMIGPHLKYLVAEAKEVVGDRNIKVALMDPKYYSILSGEKALDHIMSLFK